MWRVGVAITLTTLMIGCHTQPIVRFTPTPRPSVVPISSDLPVVVPNNLEPSLASLPKADPLAPVTTPSMAYRGLTEQQCAALAAQHSSVGNRLDEQNAAPTTRVGKAACDDGSELLRETRYWAAVEARHRDAAEAVDRFYQLADAEARTGRLVAGIQVFDELRELVPKFREVGLPTLDDDELRQQRAKLLGDHEQAQSGIQMLNIELRTRLGLGTQSPERLWPLGEFTLKIEPMDVEQCVANALANRAELRAMRTLYHGLSPATLAAVQGELPGVGGPTTPKVSDIVSGLAGRPLMQRILEKRLAPLKQIAAEEVELRRKQLFDVIAEREALAAAEVRLAADQMASSVRRVGLARVRVESLDAKVQKTKTDGKAYDRFPSEIEWQRARADLIAEVMGWHRWHAKLRAAQGLLVETPSVASRTP